MVNESEIFIALGYREDTLEGIVKIAIGRPTFSVTALAVGQVVDAIAIRPVEAVTDTVPPFVLSDDGAQSSLWMHHQQQQYGQFLAATMANGGMFE